MLNKNVLVVCIVGVLMMMCAILDTARAQSEHPQRPERFTSEHQLRQYLRELKQYYEDNVRVGRFGKRNNVAPTMLFKSYPKQHDEPEWKNDYDYYAQFNI